MVFSHMDGRDRSIWAGFTGERSSHGYAVLTYDFRGVGRSGGRFAIAQVDRDVLATVRFVRRLGERRVFLIGASLGGTASLVAAGQTRVDGVVVMASGTQWQGLDARPFLPVLRVPELFIVGSGDAPLNTSAQVMYAQPPQPKRLVVIPYRPARDVHASDRAPRHDRARDRRVLAETRGRVGRRRDYC